EGTFDLTDETGQTVPIRVRRAHLEEDAGKLLHEAPGGFRIDHSIVDLNRAGTPLLEIVTEPDFRTAKQVSLFAQELQKLVQFLGVSEGQMQLGHMRFEPNINLHITDADGVVHKTAITEVKNLNSFSVLERATAYEVQRQLHAWESTGSLGKKSTYGWDDDAGATYWQRDKEDAGDYRYFPDPDLMPVEVDDAWLAELKAQVGELPQARRKRYVSALGLSEKDAALLAGDRATGDYFEQILAAGADAKRAGTLMETLREIANERGEPATAVGVPPARLAEIAVLVAAGKLAGNKETARAVIAALAEQDRPAERAAADLGLIQSTDAGPIDALVDALIAENPKSLQDYRGGKQQARGALIGMIMKKGKGLNAKLVGERLDAKVLG
ncbi:MAG: gatB, partial [Phycisphaerales bacterium]|nr:gatB [Phycisphaerales bacterium]